MEQPIVKDPILLAQKSAPATGEDLQVAQDLLDTLNASDQSDAQILEIKKCYGRKQVLTGASFSADSGSCVGILGTNGSGKSTLLRILAGVLHPDSGSFLWKGTDLLKAPADRFKAVAYVPQGTPLIEELSALDHLRLWYEKETLQVSLENGVLRELGIHEFLKTPVSKLSGGMKKRLSIGCAMANDPSILLLDEPTAALDLVGKERILGYFERFRDRGGLLLVVTHDQRELELCDSWHILRDGRLQPCEYDGDLRRLTESLGGSHERKI